MSTISHILQEARENENFRRVVFTGARSQLVVMSISPGGEVGQETHAHVEQTLFILSGFGKAVLDGQASEVQAGDAVIVTPGTQHNILNTGTEPLKIYTIYAPPNHIDGRVHVTKVEADADTEDELFGESVQ